MTQEELQSRYDSILNDCKKFGFVITKNKVHIKPKNPPIERSKYGAFVMRGDGWALEWGEKEREVWLIVDKIKKQGWDIAFGDNELDCPLVVENGELKIERTFEEEYSNRTFSITITSTSLYYKLYVEEPSYRTMFGREEPPTRQASATGTIYCDFSEVINFFKE